MHQFKILAFSSYNNYGIPVWFLTTARSHVEALEDLEMLAVVRGFELVGDVVLV